MLLSIRSLPLSFALNLVPRMLEMAKIFWGSMPPEPPRLDDPLFIQSVILLEPAACFKLHGKPWKPTNYIGNKSLSGHVNCLLLGFVSLSPN